LPERCRKDKIKTTKGKFHNVNLSQSHPPAQREARGLSGAVLFEHSLEETPLARFFGPVWGFHLQAKPVTPKATGPRIVWSGPNTAQAFAVGESRQALSAAGVPAGIYKPMRKITQHGETEYFRLFFRSSF